MNFAAVYKNSILVIILLSFLSVLTACAYQNEYQKEPGQYSAQIQPETEALSYLALAFPDENDRDLVLQVALVKYKREALEQERWLLPQQVSYQWITVELSGERFNLLVAGPYDAGPILARKRKFLQQGLGYTQAMPVMTMGLVSKES